MPDLALELSALRLLIEDLELTMQIGVSDAERAAPQRVLVTLEVEVAARQPEHDRVEEVVDYGTIIERIRTLSGGEVRLLETLAATIAAMSLADPRVAAVTVTLRKPDLMADAGAVGIVASYRRGTTWNS